MTSAASEAPVLAGQFLTFRVAGETYATAIQGVREIIRYDVATTVPSAPAYVHGVINLRGRVVPVIDLAVKFGLAASPVTRRSCIVVAETEVDGERVTLGVLTDAVEQVVELGADEVEPPPPFGTRVRIDYLLGMGRLGERFAAILDLDRVLTAEEVAALDGGDG